MQEALSLAFVHGISAHTEAQPLKKINEVFDRRRGGSVRGRIVLDFASQNACCP
jgi:D-arabinose 1-dehydrogenase-like Zn-dependent alcohol dehydrogenase